MSAPRGLRDKIARDLRPVKPLRSPSCARSSLLPLAAAIVFAVPALRFFRSDIRRSASSAAGASPTRRRSPASSSSRSRCANRFPAGRCRARCSAWTIAAGLTLPAAVLVLTSSTFDLGPAPGRR